MSELKHTPTPWIVDGNLIFADDTFQTHIAHVEPDSYDVKTREANAKLIAAAPELLEALKIAQQYMNVFIIRGEEPLVGENLKTDSFKVIEAIKKATE